MMRTSLGSLDGAVGPREWSDGGLVRLGAALESLEGFDGARTCLAFVAVGLLAAVLMLYRLGAAEVCNSNEAVEGLVVQQMVERGDILFPSLNASEPMYKPPLFHWTATALARTLGVHDVSELTLRLPSVLYGLAGVVLTMVFVLGWLGLPSAVLAGFVLLGSYQYIGQARFGRVDMALTFYEALALFSFAWWLSMRANARSAGPDTAGAARRATAAHYVFAIALGLGVLTKGPVGTLLPLIAAIVFLVLDRRWADLRALCSPGPVLVLLTVGSSWYAAGYWSRHFDVLHRQIVGENLSRFFGGIATMPPWYYVRPLLLNSVPFSLLVPFAVARALRSRSPSEREPGHEASGAARLLAVFWLTTVIFFSIAAYKRRAYLLPLWPSAAVLLVWWLQAQGGERSRHRSQGAVLVSCGALMAFNLAYIPHAERATCGGAQYRQAVAAINRVVPVGAALYLHGVATEPAPLLFYLDRTVPTLSGALAHAPRGFVLTSEEAWTSNRAETTLRPVLAISLERQRLVLLESTPRGDST